MYVMYNLRPDFFLLQKYPFLGPMQAAYMILSTEFDLYSRATCTCQQVACNLYSSRGMSLDQMYYHSIPTCMLHSSSLCPYHRKSWAIKKYKEIQTLLNYVASQAKPSQLGCLQSKPEDRFGPPSSFLDQIRLECISRYV